MSPWVTEPPGLLLLFCRLTQHIIIRLHFSSYLTLAQNSLFCGIICIFSQNVGRQTGVALLRIYLVFHSRRRYPINSNNTGSRDCIGCGTRLPIRAAQSTIHTSYSVRKNCTELGTRLPVPAGQWITLLRYGTWNSDSDPPRILDFTHLVFRSEDGLPVRAAYCT